MNEFRNNTPLVVDHGVEAVITAASNQRAGQIGLYNTPSFFFDPLPYRPRQQKCNGTYGRNEPTGKTQFI